MKKPHEIIAATSGALIGFLFGEIDGLFYALIAFVVLDYISGVIAAFVQKDLSSEVGYKGICKKIMIFVIVAVANIIDTQVIKNGSALRTAALFLFLSNEGISLLENAGSIGLPVPQRLLEKLSQLKMHDKTD